MVGESADGCVLSTGLALYSCALRTGVRDLPAVAHGTPGRRGVCALLASRAGAVRADRSGVPDGLRAAALSARRLEQLRHLCLAAARPLVCRRWRASAHECAR